MEHRVAHVAPNSIGEELGIRPGDLLLAIDDAPVADVLDYREKITRPYLELLMICGGEEILFEIEKNEDEDLGLEFENALMDEKMVCRNRCIFCFVDQLPAYARDSLRLKDDDFRLSFLMGNYITLTNLSDGEWERILTQRISPLYISVHTTDGALRKRIMQNSRADEIVERLTQLFQHRIDFHCQIVMMKGVNSGKALQKTLMDLCAYRPYAKSVAIVPVGLTDHREGLCPLEPVDGQTARETIEIVQSVNARVGEPFAYCADEFFILAGEPLPPAAYYGDFLQIEDGVGMVRRFLDEADQRLSEPLFCTPYRATLVTGRALFPYMEALCRRISREYGMDLTVIPGENGFFGRQITVSGLLTGRDFLHAVRGKEIGECLFIPEAALREDQMFLDDMSLSQLEQAIGAPVIPIGCSGIEFVNRVVCGDWRK